MPTEGIHAGFQTGIFFFQVIDDCLLFLHGFYQRHHKIAVSNAIKTIAIRCIHSAEIITGLLCCLFHLLCEEAGHLDFFDVIFLRPVGRIFLILAAEVILAVDIQVVCNRP